MKTVLGMGFYATGALGFCAIVLFVIADRSADDIIGTIWTAAGVITVMIAMALGTVTVMIAMQAAHALDALASDQATKDAGPTSADAAKS